MRVGLIGTGAIANMHARAYRNIGFELAACSNKTLARGRDFAQRWNAEFVASTADLCRYPGLDYVDVCSFPDSHLEAVCFCAESKRHIMLQKPIATNLAEAREMIRLARAAGVKLGVMSQHRFDDATLFLRRAIAAGRLGVILEADAYVKWFRADEYYARPIKGSWRTEGGGALINQAIHQVDILLHLVGPVAEVSGMWQLGARHKIESEDIVNAQFAYQCGATGVLQAATAIWPGYTERVEIHGTNGSAIISGDRLTSWDVLHDQTANAADPAPLAQSAASGSSDPMAISVTTFERQFSDFAEAIRSGREPLSNGEEAYRALAFVIAVYRSCRERRRVALGEANFAD
jgi:UDP-N-acetyl-2-amino-2-deoxyglucuronate dehydrogenase